MVRRAVAGVFLLSFLMAAARAAEPWVLNAIDARTLLSGNTLNAVTALERFKDKPFRLHLKADGTLVVVNFDGGRDTGTWEVTSDGRYCSQYSQTRKGMRKCFRVHGAGAGHYEFRTLEGELSSTFSVRPGNPDQL